MANVIKKMKVAVSGINWPTYKLVFCDTAFVFITTIITSTLIAGWGALIETIMNFVYKLF